MLSGEGALQGCKLRADVYIEAFVPAHAEPIPRYGNELAGTVRKVGRGRTWLLGTFAVHNGTACRNEDSKAFVRAFLGECGVRPAHPGRLLCRSWPSRVSTSGS